jgi:hypothetical protein
MRTFAGISLLLLLQASAFPQEIVLRDGKRILWKSITDGKDSIEVVTTAGEKLDIKKVEISKILPATESAPVILTGASFTFKQKTKSVDLLATVNPKSDTFIGSWSLAGGTLSNKEDGQGARLTINYPVPEEEEYDLEIVTERTGGKEYMGVVLVGGGRQFLFVIDSYKGTMSGIWLLDGKGADNAKGDAVKLGTFLNPKQPVLLTFMVRKAGLVVKLNGRDFYTLAIDNWKRLSLADYHNIPKEKAFGFVIGQYAAFRISRITMTLPRD